jgi:hypothetical protein
MDARSIVVYGFLGFLTGMLLVLFLSSKCFLGSECTGQKVNEGFQEQAPPQPRTCPKGTTAYTDKVGNLNCCRGQVNGNVCEGKVDCTFSSNAADTYKICQAQRRRKYFGPINPFVKSYMSQEFIARFDFILDTLEDFKPKIKAMIPTLVTEAGYKEFENLIKEERSWYEEVRYTDEGSITYQEEVMYILTTLQSIYSSQKLSKNPGVLQQQIVSRVCRK